MPALKLTTHPPRHMLTAPGDGEEAKTVERVMGIEYIAGVRLLSANQMVASKVACCG
jgi:hypothetical protein